MVPPCSIDDICAADISVEKVGVLESGEQLYAPLHNGQPILLNLTPGEDEWLKVLAANAELLPHHCSEDAQVLHLAVGLNTPTADKLDMIENRVKDLFYKDELLKIFWKTMHLGEGKLVLNLVMEASASPTVLRFVEGNTMKRGIGHAFFKEQVGENTLSDFKCKAVVQLEFIHVAETININMTVHTIVFAKPPKRSIVDYTAMDEDIILQAAKRFKYLM